MKPAVKMLIDEIVGSIEAARASETPFYHLQFDGVFPEDTYEAILAAMPVSEDYRPMHGRSQIFLSTRLQYNSSSSFDNPISSGDGSVTDRHMSGLLYRFGSYNVTPSMYGEYLNSSALSGLAE